VAGFGRRTDFAVARMEGEPAKNPSWWTKRNAIHVTYEKIGEFWLPARNETNTQVRIVGSSLLTIVYRDYEILNADAMQVTQLREACSLPWGVGKVSQPQR